MNRIDCNIDVPQLPWFVVRVKANTEWKVARGLTGRGLPVFLPVLRRMSKRQRREPIELPLFPGYIFSQFDRNASMPVLTCPGVIHILSIGTVAQPVDPDELFALQSLSRAGCPMEPLPTFTTGQKIRIGSGPLGNVEGIVVRDDGRQRLIVSVSLLHRSVVAEIDREWLEEPQPSVGIVHWPQSESGLKLVEEEL
jgi:transcription antitermination factor NusG